MADGDSSAPAVAADTALSSLNLRSTAPALPLQKGGGRSPSTRETPEWCSRAVRRQWMRRSARPRLRMVLSSSEFWRGGRFRRFVVGAELWAFETVPVRLTAEPLGMKFGSHDSQQR